jgi:hypothetical protein
VPSDSQRSMLCPSAQPDMEQARVFGVIAGTADAPQIAYLGAGVAVDHEVVAHVAKVAPTQVFRFAAKCEESRCSHFSSGKCSLAERIVSQLSEVVDDLPVCQIRSGCRWYAEQGAAACRRCPQVVTMIPAQDDALNRAAMPSGARAT